MIEAERSMAGPKVTLVSTLVSGDRIAPFVFRSYKLPYRTQSNYKGKIENFLKVILIGLMVYYLSWNNRISLRK
jgi:hypothetical protein